MAWKTPKDEAGRELKISLTVLIDLMIWKVIIVPVSCKKYYLPNLELYADVEFRLRAVNVYGREGPVTVKETWTYYGKRLTQINMFQISV